jgi:hypothetical protein
MSGKLLVVSHSDPFEIGGGSFACHAYAKAFSECFNGNADICVPAESKAVIDDSIRYDKIIRVPKRTILSRFISLFTGDIDRYSGYVKKLIKEDSDVYSTIVINGCRESGSMVRFLKSNGIKVITIFHNFEREYFKDNFKTPLIRGMMLFHIRNLEKKAYKYSDANLFLTPDDLQKYEDIFGIRSLNFRIGVFEYKVIPSLVPDKRNGLVFVITGLLCNKQGEDGIVYFFNELYRYLPENSSLIISGLDPTRKVVELCNEHKNVTLIPNPSDMNEVVAQGDIYICPAKTGSGLKLRIMDGLRLGIPVIVHDHSKSGYESMLMTPYFKSFMNPSEFGEAVQELSAQVLENKQERALVRESYLSHFSYESGLERVKEIMNGILA